MLFRSPQWDVAWAMLTQEIGPLVGDYIAALTRMEEALRGYGQEERSPYMLLWHMMDRALARFPGASLTGAAYDAATRQAMAGIDVQDANSILEALGYATPVVPDRKIFGDEFAGRLRAFQQINDIPVSGKLDNPTLNRLFHLDFDAKNLKRAKRFKADALPK